ncbi:hypothetical protein H8356DRAFT_1354506 [Neocallimastix lanati (nom. inval.)]|nr:hypothetical protein H8356DRAFT_1354506 [Neocallimastix sp. JGI-2020a]
MEIPPPLSVVCAISQLRCFRKWKNSSCICRSFRLTMKWYSVESTVAERAFVRITLILKIITRNNGRGVIIEEWEKLEAIASNALL